MPHATAEHCRRELTGLAAALVGARPAMAVVRNRINRLMSGGRDLPAKAVADLAARQIVEAEKADRGAAAAAAEHAAGKRVLTLSRSGTVEAALLAATPAPLAVLVAESRPGGEGVALAERLVAAGIPASVLPDAAIAAALAVLGADLVLVGADAVLPDGSVVNKVGTRIAALAAREQGVPCYAVAAVDKIGEAGAGEEQGERGDLYGGGAAALAVWAPLFEVTPGGLFAGIVSERGVLTAAAVAAVAEELAGLADWENG